MDKFLETYNLPKLNHVEIGNLNRSITSKKTEAVIKDLPTNKSLRPGIFTGEFCQIFKVKLILILLKLFKTRRGGNISTVILQGQHYPDTKTREGQKQTHKRKL